MQSAYEHLYNEYGSVHPRLFFTILLAMSHTLPVCLHECMMLLIMRYNLFADRIIQPNKAPLPALAAKCWRQSFINHFVLMPLFIWVFYPYISGVMIVSPVVFPSVLEVGYHLLVCVIVEDCLFYWSHRMLHHPMVYKFFHKQHHEFKVLTGLSIAAEFTHPFESLVGNIIPVVMGPIIANCHFFTLCLWIVLRMFKTCDAHCGYSFQWSPFGLGFPLNPAERHDFHHETGKGCFGSFFVVWDTVCGTDADFLSRQRKNKVT